MDLLVVIQATVFLSLEVEHVQIQKLLKYPIENQYIKKNLKKKSLLNTFSFCWYIFIVEITTKYLICNQIYIYK